MDDAIFLHIRTLLDGDAPPVSAEHCARADIYILADPHIAGDIGLRVYKGRRIDHGNHAFECVKHQISGFARITA